MSQLPKIIGLAGHAGHGKSTVAQHLEILGYVRRHPLSDVKKSLLVMGFSAREIDGDQKDIPLAKLGGNSARKLQIDLGKMYRKLKPSFFIDGQLEYAKTVPLFVDDSVRFPNEADAILAAGGEVWLIEDPDKPVPVRWGWIGKILHKIGLRSWALDPSERVHLIKHQVHILNDGSIDDLYEKVDLELDT